MSLAEATPSARARKLAVYMARRVGRPLRADTLQLLELTNENRAS